MSNIHKYQFCIRFSTIDRNSAASKAVLDCNHILSELGYKDFTMTVKDNSNKKVYYLHLLKELARFIIAVKPNSIVAIQYPLLSINNVFKAIIKILRFRKVRFFCIIHDLESLRTGGDDHVLIEQEVLNLQSYDAVIVHNEKMLEWLRSKGLKRTMVSLELFDYLGEDSEIKSGQFESPIAYAGNLAKSHFVKKLPEIKFNRFNVYGPGLSDTGSLGDTVHWRGEFSPSNIVHQLVGRFGLVWDGTSIYHIDGPLGKYLRYNNPHKASLYLAAGLPLIAPRNTAIGEFINHHRIGVTVDSLKELETLVISDVIYSNMLERVFDIRAKVLRGDFLRQAVTEIQTTL